MALIIITINDTPNGDADIGVLSEPALDTSDPTKILTEAQLLALNMLHAATSYPETQVKEDRSLIQLIDLAEEREFGRKII